MTEQLHDLPGETAHGPRNFIELGPDEVYKIPTPAEPGPTSSFETGDGRTIYGAELATVRMGGHTEYADAKIVDVRSQPLTGNVTGLNGESLPLRQVVTDKDGQPISYRGDFMLVIPARNGSQAESRSIASGMPLNIGRGDNKIGSAVFRPGLLPNTVSNDHTAISANQDGNLQIENHNPSNKTRVALAENVATREDEHNLSNETAIEWLSYADVLEGAEREQFLEFTKNSPNGMKYVHEIQAMISKFGGNKVLELADQLKDKAMRAAGELGITPSKFMESRSWVLWDLAKQSYLFKHPEESSPDYSLGDPMSNEHTRNGIIHRHLGWEIARAVEHGQMRPDQLNIGPFYAREIEATIENGARNETQQFRSFVFAQIGRRALRAAGLTLHPREKMRLIK